MRGDRYITSELGLLFALLSLSLLCGCNRSTNIGSVGKWFEIQDIYAEMLDRNIGGEKFCIVPIKGAIYEIGTVLDQNSPASADCVFDGSEIDAKPMSLIPEINDECRITVDANVPQKWINAIVRATAKVHSARKTTFKMKYGDLEQRFVYESDLNEKLSTDICMQSIMDLGEGKKTLIRGHIKGTLSIVQGQTDQADAKLSVEDDGFTVTYFKSGGFKIEDPNQVPRFAIVTDIIITKENVKIIEPAFVERSYNRHELEKNVNDQQWSSMLCSMDGGELKNVSNVMWLENNNPNDNVAVIYRVQFEEPDADIADRLINQEDQNKDDIKQ